VVEQLIISPALSVVSMSLAALDEWNTVARDALPSQVKVWLGLMMLNNLAGLAFVYRHVAARWVFAGFVISHLIVMLGYWGRDLPVLAGQVSLFHVICWTPGIIALIRWREEIKWVSPYAIWASLVFVFYVGSMFIDLRDASIYLMHVIGGG